MPGAATRRKALVAQAPERRAASSLRFPRWASVWTSSSGSFGGRAVLLRRVQVQPGGQRKPLLPLDGAPGLDQKLRRRQRGFDLQGFQRVDGAQIGQQQAPGSPRRGGRGTIGTEPGPHLCGFSTPGLAEHVTADRNYEYVRARMTPAMHARFTLGPKPSVWTP